MIEAKNLINLPIASEEDQEKVGEIIDIVIEPENGRVLGFLVKAGGMFSTVKALSVVDVRDWDPNGIVTRTFENIVEPKEIIRLNELYEKKIILLNMKAKTESGKSLGKVENYLIDTETEMVVKYYLKDLLGNTRVLSNDKVIEITDEVVFLDDIETPPIDAESAIA